MQNSRRRFLIYAIFGFIFGVIDWFYLAWLANMDWGSLGSSRLAVPIIIALNYGIWLIPIIPIAIYEARHTKKLIFPILAGMLTWSCAIFSYYTYYAILLSLGRLPNLGHLNLMGEKDASFWSEYWQMFNRIILWQFIEWIIIALLGGAVIGVLAFWLFRIKQPDEDFTLTHTL